MQAKNQNQAGKALRIPAFFDKLYPSEEMDLCYARQAFRRDFHYFKFFWEGGLKCHLWDL